tara:strand:+ start:611 stop:1075 length:465 start_codon:yes stop_codon:yes gene_type:complete
MGYKTKSMINAVGSIYGAGNVDPGYDSAAYLKTKLEDAGGQLGSLAGNAINKKKGLPLVPTSQDGSPGPTQGRVIIPVGGTNYNLGNESINNKIKQTILKTGEEQVEGLKEQDESLDKILGIDNKTNPGFGGDGFKMMGDGFNKGMLRKNKYKK